MLCCCNPGGVVLALRRGSSPRTIWAGRGCRVVYVSTVVPRGLHAPTSRSSHVSVKKVFRAAERLSTVAPLVWDLLLLCPRICRRMCLRAKASHSRSVFRPIPNPFPALLHISHGATDVVSDRRLPAPRELPLARRQHGHLHPGYRREPSPVPWLPRAELLTPARLPRGWKSDNP